MQQPRGDTRGSPTRESKPSEQRGEHDSQTDKRDAHHSAGIPSHTVMGSKNNNCCSASSLHSARGLRKYWRGERRAAAARTRGKMHKRQKWQSGTRENEVHAASSRQAASCAPATREWRGDSPTGATARTLGGGLGQESNAQRMCQARARADRAQAERPLSVCEARPRPNACRPDNRS